MTYNFDNYEKDTLTLPRDEAWGNWKSWKDAKIGDKVQGYIADAFYRPAEGDMKEQRGITIRQQDGVLINVGIKMIDFILKPTDNLRIGDPITIKFTEQQQPQKKGQQGAKIFSYFGTNLPANAGNKTVKEMTDADRNKGGSVGGAIEDTMDSVAADMEEAAQAF
jgi:hypothetical protein